MSQRYSILTIGKTHSGKTTFANDIAKLIPNSEVLETDSVALFLKSHYPHLRIIDVDHSGGFASPSLKFRIFNTILTFALEKGFNIILSNANLYEKGREEVLKIIKGYSGKTIAVYFNYPEEVLFERAKTSGRDTKVLSTSKDFNELIVNQRMRFEAPNSTRFDYFFEVTDAVSLEAAKQNILKLCSKNLA